MQKGDQENIVFNLAADLVNHTACHVFLTGKAGTGKTTFLKHIKETTLKKCVVVAPTGVAAINAGGVTAHSLFQLPFGPFVPGSAKGKEGFATDRHSLFRNIRFSASKREVLEELELLIIDEISMMRADMLDAIDTVLKHFRKQYSLPFGGVQVLYIGDMYQLPPVVNQEEWELLKQYYKSPFFFDAKVLETAAPVSIELEKIYRQNDQQFIDILNRIRHNDIKPRDLEILNQRYDPEFHSKGKGDYITLTTHNRKADLMNDAALNELPGSLCLFDAKIKGEFSEKALPTDGQLRLKQGAQVMFIKNDTGEDRHYYNGKLAVISRIEKDEIYVSFPSEDKELKLERETWKNIKYSFDKENNRMDEEELGSFSQYPIRLAWAITIHKSQGLTFNSVVIDAGESFAPGQVYVALSRCVSMDGLVLHSRIRQQAIYTDPRIVAFSTQQQKATELNELLLVEKEKFQRGKLLKIFSFHKMEKRFNDWELFLKERENLKDEGMRLLKSFKGVIIQQSDIAVKFRKQLAILLEKDEEKEIETRVNKAIEWFGSTLYQQVCVPIREHLNEVQHLSRAKQYREWLIEIDQLVVHMIREFGSVRYKDIPFTPFVVADTPTVLAKKKSEKGSSQRETLALYFDGKSVEEIAGMRGLAKSTIEGHLCDFILTGDLGADVFIGEEKLKAILECIQTGDSSMSAIRIRLGDDFSWTEIRAGLNHFRYISAEEKISVP